MKAPTAKDLHTQWAKAIRGKSVTSEPPNSPAASFCSWLTELGDGVSWLQWRVRCRKLDVLGSGNVDAPENANSDTTNTIIAAIHILLADGLTLFVSA